MSFLLALKSVGILLAMAVPGFLVIKTKLLKEESAVQTLSVMLLYVCQPFIIVNSFLNTTFEPRILANILILMLVTTLLILALLVLSKMFLCADPMHNKRDIACYATAFGNIGFMCIPFLQVLGAGSEVVLYAATTLTPFNLLGWTLGSYLLTGDKKFISVKKAIFNVPTLSFLLVLPLFICNINFVRYPVAELQNAVRLFADLTAPLSMVMLGMRAANMKPKELFLDPRGYFTIALKLLLQPMLAFLIFSILMCFGDFSALRLNIIALAAMPAATNVMMFASIYKKDTGAAAAYVLLTNIFSILTIPLMFLLFM